MNFNCEKTKLGFFDTVYESTVEQSLEADITLPDYCPEIQKVLRCCVDTNVISVHNYSGRVTAEAQAIVRIIYIGDNGNTAAYEQSYALQKFIESEKINSDCCVTVWVNTDYVNCRAVNQRKADIRAMLTFTFKAICKNEKSVLCDAYGSGIQLMKKEYEYFNLIGLCEKSFSMSEVVELGNNKNSVSQILNVSGCVVTNEIKIINNKVLIKGECNVKIYYLSEENGSIESFEHSMPLSQIAELSGVDENSFCNIDMKVSSCEATVKADTSGNMRLIDLEVIVNAYVLAFNDTDLTLIEDAYSTEFLSDVKYKNIELYEYNDRIDNSFINKVVLESIGVSVECVQAVWCSGLKHKYSLRNGKSVVEGTYQANVLYKDAEDKMGLIQKPVDFSFESALRKKAEKIMCYTNVNILACSCSVLGESKLELKAEIALSELVISVHNKKYVSEIEISDVAVKKDDLSALTIYFAKSDEKIWDIAKHYNTTTESILSENEISDKKLMKDSTLMIPLMNKIV